MLLAPGCASFLVVHEGSLGIGRYEAHCSEPAPGARYCSIRGYGLLLGRRGLLLGFVDEQRLEIDPQVAPLHVASALAEVWLRPDSAVAEAFLEARSKEVGP